MKKALACGSTMVEYPVGWSTMTFADHQAQVLADDDTRVTATMRAALRVLYIHDAFFKTKDNPKPPRLGESGFDTFKDWCESIDRTEQWGHYLVRAAEHAGRVENPRQARALSGLSSKQADAVVKAAKGAGPVTAQTLKAAREATVKENRDAVRQIEDAAHLRKMLSLLKKLTNTAQQYGGMPEWFFKNTEKAVRHCQQQLGIETEMGKAA